MFPISLVIIFLAWFCGGLLGCFLDDEFTVVNWLILIFVVVIPFFPWICWWLGL